MAIYTNSDLWQNEGAIHILNYLLSLNIDYVVWFVLKVINKIMLMADVSFAKTFSVVENDVSILNPKIIFDR